MALETHTDELMVKALQSYRKIAAEKQGQLIEALVDFDLSPEQKEQVIHRIEELTAELCVRIDAIILETSPKESIVPGFIEAPILDKTG